MRFHEMTLLSNDSSNQQQLKSPHHITHTGQADIQYIRMLRATDEAQIVVRTTFALTSTAVLV